MKKIIILSLAIIFVFLLAACNLKININSNLNESTIDVKETKTDDTGDVEDLETEGDEVISEYEVITDEEGMILQIVRGEVTYEDLAEFCGTQVMVYAQPDNKMIIFKPFDPGSDQPVKNLYAFNFDKIECQELEISQELTDFGARVLSPDQTKLALALETNEANELKLLDLVNDKALTLIELDEGETLNAGYGAMSNHFDIKWLDNKMIQYTVFEETVANYDDNAPQKIEKVLQVRVINID